MKDKISNLAPVTDMELLEKAMFYFASLRRIIPVNRLEDACSGILVLIHELLLYLDKHKLTDFGNDYGNN